MIVLNHQTVTEWVHENGAANRTEALTDDEARANAQRMENLGYWFEGDYCVPECPRCEAGFTEPGPAITIDTDNNLRSETMTTFTYDLPKRFIDDHLSRTDQACWDGFDWDANVRETKTAYRITLTDDQASELLSDAEFYADMGVKEYGPEFLGLISSARATAKRLRVQNVQQRGGAL